MIRSMTIDEWERETKRVRSPAKRARLHGPSPGRAAEEMGVTRQAVHRAIERGTLDALRVTYDEDGEKLAFMIITEASFERYQKARSYREAMAG